MITLEAEPIEILMTKIMDRYNRKPEGWNVLADRKGNVLFLGPRGGYKLKLIPLNPQEYTGVGMKIDKETELWSVAKGTPSYGFRPLSSKETKLLLNNIHQRGVIQNNLVNRLLGMKPISLRQLQNNKPKAVLSGPVIAHPDLSTISKSQRELEKKLLTESYRLFKEKYPGRAATYR